MVVGCTDNHYGFPGSNIATMESSTPNALGSIAGSLHASQTETRHSFTAFSSSVVSKLSGLQPAAASTDYPSGSALSSNSNPMQSAVTDLPNPASGSSPSGKSPLTITSSAASIDHSIDPNASQLGGSSVRPPQQSPDSAVGYQSHQSLNVTEGGEQGPTTPRNQLTSAGLGPMILSGLGTADLTTINQQTSRQQVPSMTMSSSAPQASSIAESVISPGGSAITISGTQFSLGSVGLVVGPKILTMKLLDPTVANPA